MQGRLGGTLEEIRTRVRASRVVKSDETGARVQGRKAWEWGDVQYALDAGDAVFAPAMLAWLQRAIKVGQQRHRRDLRKRLEAILQLEPQQADGQRLRKRHAKCKEGLLVFVTDREVPFTNNESERALRPSVIFRKVTNGTRSEWGAEFFAAVRSVIGTGRLNGLSPFDAIAMTIDGRSILNPT